MTAGKGVFHKECLTKDFSNRGGVLHLIQLWVDLPKKHKMTDPKYQTIFNKDMGKISLENNVGYIDIISGEVFDTKGPANTYSNINLYVVNLNQDKELILNEHITII